MTSISNQSELESWASNGNTGTLTQNITLADNTNFPLDLADGSILDGDGYTITLMSANTGGLFEVTGTGRTIIIKNLKVDADAITTMNNDEGVIFRYMPNLAALTLTIENCASVGSFNIGDSGGGIVGRTHGTSATRTLTVNNCFSTGTISGASAGGIVGGSQGAGHALYINNCYSTGNISGTGAGGVAGDCVGRSSSGSDRHIKSCYSTGEISGTDAGGILGREAGCPSIGGDAYIVSNCYTFGAISGANAGGILGDQSGNGTIEYSYAKGATSASAASGGFVNSEYSGHTVTINNSRFGS